MADFNTSITQIDFGMDCFERIQETVASFDKLVRFDIRELGRSITLKISSVKAELESLYTQLNYANGSDEEDDGYLQELYEQIAIQEARVEALETLLNQQRQLENTYASEANSLISSISGDIEGGLREMANYLRQIGDICKQAGIGGSGSLISGNSGNNYFVVVIDSSKYPESAEHIKTSIKNGQPSFLTLDRDGADANRAASLRGIPTRSEFDRDEFPPAAFREGGAGADVFYLNRSDNRGSGSSFRHQLTGIPNGTTVRFRVI